MSKGGRDDTSAYANPFSAQPSAGGGGLLSSIFGGGGGASPMGVPSGVPVGPVGQSTPQSPNPLVAAGDGYSPLRDPEGPLARAGWIGALLANGPSRTDHINALKQQQADALGKDRAAAFQTLSGFVQAGEPPQKAFMHFLNTPQGVQFVTKDPNPSEAIQAFMKLATVPADPTADAITAAFSGGGGGTPGAQAPVGAAPTAATTPGAPAAAGPVPPMPAIPSAPGAPNMGAVTPQDLQQQGVLTDQPAAPLHPLIADAISGDSAAAPLGGDTPGTVAAPAAFKPSVPTTGDPSANDIKDPSKSTYWMDKARRLASVVPRKDADGKTDNRAGEASQRAMEIAKTMYAAETGGVTDDLKEYNAVVKQNNAAGVNTPPLQDWLLQNHASKATKVDVNTAEGQEALGFKTRSDMDKLDYEKNYAPAAKGATDMLSTLQAVSQFVDAPSGITGVGAAELAKWADVLGIDVTKPMKDAQNLQALTAKMSAAFRPVGTGSTSDYEQKLFQSAVPGLMQNADTRKAMMLIAKKFAQRTIDEAHLLRDNSGSKELSAKRDALANKPILDDNDIKALQQYSGADPTKAAAPTSGPGTPDYVPTKGEGVDVMVNGKQQHLIWQGEGIGWK